jgi:hypothetical protein
MAIMESVANDNVWSQMEPVRWSEKEIEKILSASENEEGVLAAGNR